MSLSVAIVGSGPSGYYTADALLKAAEGCQIDVLDRLPAPFGLIRYGVAPDHQTTKNVSRNFTKTALLPQVRYFGNVEMGRDVTLDQLKQMYDAVVLAVGSPLDRPAGLPGEDKRGVIGSAAFVGWYNGHPDFRDLDPMLDTETVVVIGNGNVAIDVARVLVKTREEMAPSDIPAYALDAIQAAPIRDVYMCGRRGPVEAKFTNVELREMGHLEIAAPVVDAAQLPDELGETEGSDRDRRVKQRNLESLREFTSHDPNAKPKRVHFSFFSSPVEILGGERVEAIRMERTQVIDGRARGTGEFFEIPCGLVVPAIGYRSDPVDGVPFDDAGGIVVNDDGRVEDNVYAVGWVKRGPTGTIATNRPDGKTAAEYIVADRGAGGRDGRGDLLAHLGTNGARIVGFDDWQRIDAAEVAAARPESPREKMITVDDMLAFLDAG